MAAEVKLQQITDMERTRKEVYKPSPTLHTGKQRKEYLRRKLHAVAK